MTPESMFKEISVKYPLEGRGEPEIWKGRKVAFKVLCGETNSE